MTHIFTVCSMKMLLKLVVLCFCLIYLSSGESEELHEKSLTKRNVLTGISKRLPFSRCNYKTRNPVTFYFKSSDILITELLLQDDINKLNYNGFNPNLRTMFVIHGFKNNKNSSVNNLISNALIEVGNWNVFIVDWSSDADTYRDCYSKAAKSIPETGEQIAEFIELLQKKTNVKLENIYLAGHSLGAHVAGNVGKYFSGEIPVIIGMDPALPTFGAEDKKFRRLGKWDAKYVQVIHSNGNILGIREPIGHADFYPNGGKRQPGCGLDPFGKCAHRRSYEYFAESILSNNFLALSCPSSKMWRDGKCKRNNTAKMGGNNIDITATGKFYLSTASRSPYALSSQGTTRSGVD